MQPGVAFSPLALPVAPATGGGLSLDGNLDAVLHDDHTEDTPPTAVPGHFGYSAEELLARMMEDEDDDDDAEETALRKPVTATVPWAPAEAAAEPEVAPAAPVAPPVAAPAQTLPVVAAPQAAPAGTVQMPMWVLAVLFMVIGGLAGAVLTMFIARL